MKATVWWFSGTGNSWLIAARMAVGLEAGGWEAELRPIEDCPKPGRSLAATRRPGDSDTIGAPPIDPKGFDLICFPVFSFSAPAIVDRFIARLPVAIGRKAALVATMGGKGYEGRALVRSARRLKDNGRAVVLAEALEMPEAYVQFYSATPEEESARRTEAGLAAADGLVADILSGRERMRAGRPAGLALTWIASEAFDYLGRRILGLTWTSTKDCNGCGLCARTCPKKTIKMASNRPHWGPKCEDCQRCANLCPQGAIRMSIPRLVLLVLPILVPWGRILEGGLGLQGGDYRLLLWIAGLGASTALLAILLRFLDFVPGLRGFLAISLGASFRRRLAPGFLAELGRMKKKP